MGALSTVKSWFGRLFGSGKAQPTQVIDFDIALVRDPDDIASIGIEGLDALVGACTDVESRGTESPWYAVLHRAAQDGVVFDIPIVMAFEENAPEDRVLRAQIVGFLHDDMAEGEGKAAITCLARAALPVAYAMNDGHDNAGGWASSRMRRFHTRFLLGLFPKALRRSVKPVRKLSGRDGEVLPTKDQLWLPSTSELFGTRLKGMGAAWEKEAWATSTLPSEGAQLPYFARMGLSWDTWQHEQEHARAALCARHLTNSGSAVQGSDAPQLMWTRSSCGADGQSFLAVDEDGRVRARDAATPLSVVVGFCL